MGKLRDKKFKRGARKAAKAGGEALWKVAGGPAKMMQEKTQEVERLGETATKLMKDPSSHPRHMSQQSTVPKDAKPRIVVKPLKKYKKPE